MTASAASGPVTTWGGRAGRIALAAASFAIAGVALEVALRLLGAGPVPVNPDQRSLWAYHPKLGWTSRAGYEGTFDNGFFSVHVAINSRGLRGDEVSLQKPVGVRRVLVVGDSFGWGFGVEQEDTFGARLERALPDTEVIRRACCSRAFPSRRPASATASATRSARARRSRRRSRSRCSATKPPSSTSPTPIRTRATHIVSPSRL